jgi:hypothetical protein
MSPTLPTLSMQMTHMECNKLSKESTTIYTSTYSFLGHAKSVLPQIQGILPKKNTYNKLIVLNQNTTAEITRAEKTQRG